MVADGFLTSFTFLQIVLASPLGFIRNVFRLWIQIKNGSLFLERRSSIASNTRVMMWRLFQFDMVESSSKQMTYFYRQEHEVYCQEVFKSLNGFICLKIHSSLRSAIS